MIGGWRSTLALAGLAAACAAPLEPPSRRPDLLSGLVTPPPFTSPARWDYHPRQPAGSVEAVMPLGERQLLLTSAGERWLQGRDAHAEVAIQLAPEPLAGVVQRDDGSFRFVGASGALYVATSALGDFVSSSAPERPLARVAVTRSALLGITRSGELVRSEDLGANWSSAGSAGQQGRGADVALLESGFGLALFLPEQLFTTRDFGRSWTQLPGRPFGAIALEVRDQAIEVRGVLDRRRWRPDRDPPWDPLAAEAGSAIASLSLAVRLSARAIAAGHARASDGRYVEIERREGRWVLHQGSALEALQAQRVAALDRCVQLRLATAKGALHVACGEQGEGSLATRLLTSRDGGRSWDERTGLVADFSQLDMVAVSGDRLVVSGICPPERRQPGCIPDGVFVTEAPTAEAPPGKGAPVPIALRRLSVPVLDGLPLGMGVTADGDRLLLFGTRTKGESLVVFGASTETFEFSVEEVPEIAVERDTRFAKRASLVVENVALGPDQQFGVTLLDRSTGRRAILVVDERGRVQGLGAPPVESALLGAAGGFAVALDPVAGEAWESLDGGASWEPIGSAPKPSCGGAGKACSTEIRCWSGGCVVDDQYSRVGWRGQRAAPPHPLPPQRLSSAVEHELRSPIACRFEERSRFETLAASQAPGAGQAAIGEVSWFAFNADWEQANVTLHEAVEQPTPRVESTEFFPKAQRPAEHTLYASLQIEGAAALRQADGEPARVAWRNLFEGRRTQRAQLPSEVTFASRPTRFAAKLAQPELLSISRGGLFARVSPRRGRAVSYFASEQGVHTTTPFAWPEVAGSGRGEMIQTDAEPIVVSMIAAGAAVVRLRSVGQAWVQDAVTLGLLDPARFDLRQGFDLAYSGDRPGFHLMFLEGNPSRGWWFPFQSGPDAFGAPVEVPNQSDLSDSPRVCTRARRGTSPRVVVPAERQTRHPVMITHTTEPFGGMLTGEAVVFGTPDDPCVAMLHATGVARQPRGDEAAEVSALVVPDGVSSSWLFRRLPNGTELDYRRMTCRYEPTLDVPSELTRSPE